MNKTQQERIFIHKPGADKMTLVERIEHISLYGQIRIVCSIRSSQGLPDCAIIAWYLDPNKPINRQISSQ